MNKEQHLAILLFISKMETALLEKGGTVPKWLEEEAKYATNILIKEVLK